MSASPVASTARQIRREILRVDAASVIGISLMLGLPGGTPVAAMRPKTKNPRSGELARVSTVAARTLRNTGARAGMK
ncbi:hypothetical protein [Burkholderia sp. MSMB1459WGS]|uniref:hypothetical protein n=1 Tax=Burkholderia sp. MSMB1459WGS TaxID=1637970 RepID=UPI0012E359F4|nr:hypothetical protein [Burkholderia sp. MSMB1459WGS]